MKRTRVLLGAALVGLLALGACGTDSPAEAEAEATTTAGDETGADPTGSDDLAGELTVFAAASLNIVFEDIADIFTEQHPDAAVAFSFAGSSDLVAQLDAGAPADVLATANESTMDDAVAADAIDGEPVIFADNVLTLITPAGNPTGVTGLDDSLDDAALIVCAPQVPCGAATATLTELMDVSLQPVSEEANVTDVLGKVTSGQADVGLVYTTDAASAGDDVDIIEVPEAREVVNRYPIAVTADTDVPDLAQAWLDLIAGAEAREVLSAAGFGTP